VLFAAALYVPTTVTDLTADTKAGDTTFAVRFGAGSAYRLGLALWGAALAFSLLCAALDVMVPRSTLIPQLVMVPVLLAAYAVLTRHPTITRMAAVSAVFAIPTVGFVVAYLR
jgi:4-hydroxybenzoate polyprenyltransferase